MDLPASVVPLVERWLARMDRDLPDVLVGCWAVGSLALDDFSDHRSSIDLVACAETAWTDEQRRTATAATGELRRHGRPGHVVLTTFDELAGSGAHPDPYTRDVLHDAPVVRGPARPRSIVRDGELERWAAGELSGTWAPWARRARARPAKRWMKRSVTPPVLEVCRLYAATQGHVLSKTDAAALVLAEAPKAPGRKRILDESFSWRHGASTSNYWGPVERKRDALQLINDLTGKVGQKG